GVAGIGEKTAKGLLEKYGDLTGVYEHLNEITGATNTKLSQNKETAFLSYELATIKLDSPIGVSLADCVLRMPFPYSVKEKFAELEFKSLIALDVFDEPALYSLERTDEKKEYKVEEKIISESSVALDILNNSSAAEISVYFDDKALTFFLENKGAGKENDLLFEYVLPIKRDILDVGFFIEQLSSVFKAIFTGKRKVIAYGVKELKHKLKFCKTAFTAEFDDVAILKCLSDGLSNGDSLEYCLDYHGFDSSLKAYGVFRLKKEYYQTLNDEEKELYEKVEKPLLDVLFEMENTGVCVNESALNELSKKYALELAELTKKIHDLAGEEFNINSTLQLGVVLFEKLKIGGGSVKKSKGKSRYKTTAEELEKYADEYEIVRHISRYRQAQKLNSTYVEGFKPLIKNGKVHTTYNQINTTTGRLSSSNPNLQNIPIRTAEGRELRKLFMASENCVLIDADYSQIELRLLAHFSACKELREAYQSGVDIHTVTASQVFGVPVEKVSGELRRSAKAVNFGIIYGISAFGLSEDLGIAPKKAQEYI
ncbi:MAG: DNA polymerase I, partial [Clostridia bacterium]|nr:DNA polymerase I [Clostridia bacterium]